MAEKAVELTIGTLLDVPPIFNGQTFDVITWQARLYFSCKSLGFMFSLWRIWRLTWRKKIPLHGQRDTHCCYAMGSLLRTCVGSVDDGQLSTKIDQGPLLKLVWGRKSFEMNLSFCYQIVVFSRNKAAQVYFYPRWQPNAGRRFLGLFEISFSALS